MIKAYSEFIDNNPISRYYPTLIDKATLHNNILPLIITRNSDNKLYIPKDITIGIFKEISSDHYNIIEITLTAKLT